MTGHEFRQLRRDLGYSQERLAKALEVERKTIIRLEARVMVPKVYQLAMSFIDRISMVEREAA